MTNLGSVGSQPRTAIGVAAPAWGSEDDDSGRVSPNADLTAALNPLRGRPIAVLTGTSMSTGSGLSDYRGRDAAPCSPMTSQEFTGSNLSRRHYWTRSTMGWDWFEAVRPGLAHLALTGLDCHTPLAGIITQNIDGPHQVAGSEPVVDLCDNLACVVCLGYGRLSGCAELQVRLLKLDPKVATRFGDLSERARTAPDDDAEIESMTGLTYPACPVCGNVFKPDVVYLGENARREMAEATNTLFDAAGVLLVLGSTLTVTSGLWFARRIAKQDKDMVIAGGGVTRADDLITLRIHGHLERILPFWADALRAG